MRHSISFALLLSVPSIQGFFTPRIGRPSTFSRVRVGSSLSTSSSSAASEATIETQAPLQNVEIEKNKKKSTTLALITFDLDDTLYPIASVIDEANSAFAKAMEKYGYEGIQPSDINLTGKEIREEISAEDPERAAILTHTEIRELAIRREMEKNMLKRKLQETADDWATPVSDLADVVVSYAKK